MSIVATAASLHGITVVADRLFTRTTHTKEHPFRIYETIRESTKVFFSDVANIAFVIWGEVETNPMSHSEPIFDQVIDQISKSLKKNENIHSVASFVKEILVIKNIQTMKVNFRDAVFIFQVLIKTNP